MNERGRNESDISRYTDVEYSPEGYKTVYRWGDFLEIAGGHVYNAMDTIDLVSTGAEKKPEIAVAVKPDPVELGHRAAVAAGSTAGDCARRAGIKQ